MPCLRQEEEDCQGERGAVDRGEDGGKAWTKGQKPVYELPPAERTPSTFGNTANARSSPAATTAVKAETPTPTPSCPSRSSPTSPPQQLQRLLPPPPPPEAVARPAQQPLPRPSRSSRDRADDVHRRPQRQSRHSQESRLPLPPSTQLSCRTTGSTIARIRRRSKSSFHSNAMHDSQDGGSRPSARC